MDKALIVGFVLWLLCGAIVFLAVGDTIRERIRRKKHPKWYTLYNLAVKNSLYIGSRFSKKTESINNRIKKVQDMFLNGECTEDEYKDAMKFLVKEYSDAVKWFKLVKEELCIDADLEAADAYAKEHNLKWGIIYEDAV
jgi:hypothetical protein